MVYLDFADFATAASPLAPSHAASSISSGAAAATQTAAAYLNANRPYTAWYRVWERTSLSDFYQELIVIPVILVIVLVNIIGTRANRTRAKKWASTYLPMLDSEYASIGFDTRKNARLSDAKQEGLALSGSTEVPEDMLKEKSKSEYIAYCTGRQNVAWLDIKITLYKRYNPLSWFGETALAFFSDSVPDPCERVEATAYSFDGKEKTLLPSAPASKDSTYDGFVFAVVHKDKMRTLRDERYDISLTTTKDHPKLPNWATVMSESAEVTEAMLTPELIKAVTDAGEDLEALIITDQPIDAPKKYVHHLGKTRNCSRNTTNQTLTDSTTWSPASASTSPCASTPSQPQPPSSPLSCACPTTSSTPRTSAPKPCARCAPPAKTRPASCASSTTKRSPRSAACKPRSSRRRSATADSAR